MKNHKIEGVDWRKIIKKYQPENWRSIWQIINTLVPYIGLFALMFWSVSVSYWLTLLLSIPTAGFMVRTFIIFHDCGHGSFFKSKRANLIVGIITGILVYTPWQLWWHEHNVHHANAGNLDKRGIGDVDTWTVEEYLAAPFWKKFWYRIMRHPLVMFSIGAMIVFAVVKRFPLASHGKKERASIWWTNLALLVLISGLMTLVGWKTFLIVQLPILLFGTSAGGWMFYVQHNYESVYWERQENWDFYKAAMDGSSLYELPAILQWFTGNIGFHHIHHLGSRIPNYKLQQCFEENPLFQVKSLNMWTSLKTLRLRLWDEAAQKMVGWEVLKKYRKETNMA